MTGGSKLFRRKITQALTEAAMIIKERYQEWGNDLWIPFEIRNTYAELTGTPLKLPALF